MNVEFIENFFKVKLELENFRQFTEVSTDSRSVKVGALFVALKGGSFDGNQFIKSAYENGAVAALVSDSNLAAKFKNTILVNDSLKAFQDLGKAWQEYVNPKVIGITGSNGKTTTKFFTSQLLAPFFKVCHSPKSFNNSFGVPITQLLLKEGDEVLVSEIGTNSSGEIEELTGLVNPDVSLVTTVGPSHLEGFGTVENVALEKQEIYNSIKAKVRIFNLDNEFTKKMYEVYGEEKITVSSQNEKADIFLKAQQINVSTLSLTGVVFQHELKINLALFGAYNVYNIMMALASGRALGVSVESLLKNLFRLQTPWGRSQVLLGENGVRVLFDGYNSNLQSMRALLRSVGELQEKNLHLVLGEMLELGDEAEAMHEELGKEVASLNTSSVIFIGSSFQAFSRGYFGASKASDNGPENRKNLLISGTYKESLAIKLKTMLDKEHTVVLKASRGMKIERFLPFLGL